jgi:hypothetical protein
MQRAKREPKQYLLCCADQPAYRPSIKTVNGIANGVANQAAVVAADEGS